MKKHNKLYSFILSALFAAVTVICAWITIPTTVPFTLQTLAVCLMAQLLPLKYSLLSITIYIAMGAVGLPVFSGFQGGVGVLFGPTGGYILGFVFIVLVTGLVEKFLNDSPIVRVLAMFLGLLLCYLFGTLWFAFVTKTSLLSAVVLCVLPYVVFDGAKIILAALLYKRLKKQIEAGKNR